MSSNLMGSLMSQNFTGSQTCVGNVVNMKPNVYSQYHTDNFEGEDMSYSQFSPFLSTANFINQSLTTKNLNSERFPKLENLTDCHKKFPIIDQNSDLVDSLIVAESSAFIQKLSLYFSRMLIKPTLMPRHYIYKRPFTVGSASRLESYSSKMKKLTKGSKKKFHHKKTRKNVRKKSPNFVNNPKSKRKKLEKMSSVVPGVNSSKMYQESESDSWYTTDTSCIDSDSSCGINKTHSAKDNDVVYSNVSTFLIAVQSDDHDDSDWDDNSDSDTLNETSDIFITCSSKASDAFNVDEVRECSSEDACDSDDSSNSMDNRICYDKNFPKPYSRTSTFVIPLESDSDDDSDWDEATDSEWSADDLDFSFPGLYLDNLNSTPKTITSIFTLDDDSQTNPFLLEVNRKWNEANMEIIKKPKSSKKVSFAPEEKLVQVLEVESYNRKGEWEIYALERVRFKNRINELEKVISPCLSKEHRQKVFQKMYEAQ